MKNFLPDIIRNPRTHYIFDVDGTLTNPAYPLTKEGYAYKLLKPYVFELINLLHTQNRLSIITSGLTGLPISQKIVDMINEKTHRKENELSHFDLMVHYINLEPYQGQPPQSRVEFVLNKFLEDPSRPVVFYGDSPQDYADYLQLTALASLDDTDIIKDNILYIASEGSFMAQKFAESFARTYSPLELYQYLLDDSKIAIEQEALKLNAKYQQLFKQAETKIKQSNKQ